jgi:signal peptide peptidase SppA
MSLAGLVTRLQTEPIAIAPQYLAAILHAFETFGEAALTQIQRDPAELDLERVGNIAIIPIRGAILKNPDAYDLEHGCCDVDAVRNMAEYAAADPSIEKVLLQISSPGGSVLGVPETGAALARLAATKRTFAWTDTVAASAAYWFASQAEAIYTSESARVGSIGVYSLFLDASKALEDFGVKVNALQAGKFKLAGAPFRPMSDEEKAHLQRGVDRIRDQFHGAVRAKRTLKEGCMEGQCFDGADAVENGLADGIISDLSEALELLAGA